RELHVVGRGGLGLGHQRHGLVDEQFGNLAVVAEQRQTPTDIGLTPIILRTRHEFPNPDVAGCDSCRPSWFRRIGLFTDFWCEFTGACRYRCGRPVRVDRVTARGSLGPRTLRPECCVGATVAEIRAGRARSEPTPPCAVLPPVTIWFPELGNPRRGACANSYLVVQLFWSRQAARRPPIFRSRPSRSNT